MPWKKIPLGNGYDLYEGLSFFQKTIREGKTKQALYWGHYLFLEKSFATSAFRRMRIITHEDIGLANLEAIILIDELHNKWNEEVWEKRDNNLWKIGVKYLCESPKNKENDWFLIMAKHHIKDGWEPTKESNLYTSTRDGKEENAFYYANLLRKKDDKKLWMTLKDSMADDQFTRACYNSYQECKKSKGADGFWSLAILYISREIYTSFIELDVKEKILDLLKDKIEINIEEFKPEIPDYYYDMHTYKGRIEGRSFRHWYSYCKPKPFLNIPNEKFKLNRNMVDILDRHSRKRK